MIAPAPLRPRRGLVSVAMLIGLIIVGIVAGGLFRAASHRRELARIEENRLQAASLADSGLDRALARLDAHPDYRGEVWELAATDLGGRGGGRIRIEVGPVPGRAELRRVVVIADSFAAGPDPSRQSRTLDVPTAPHAR